MARAKRIMSTFASGVDGILLVGGDSVILAIKL